MDFVDFIYIYILINNLLILSHKLYTRRVRVSSAMLFNLLLEKRLCSNSLFHYDPKRVELEQKLKAIDRIRKETTYDNTSRARLVRKLDVSNITIQFHAYRVYIYTYIFVDARMEFKFKFSFILY